MNYHFLVIRVRDNARRVNVGDYDRVWSKQDSDGSDVEVPILVRIDPGECAVRG